MLYMYDDAVARTFAPFAATRPVSELRAGTSIIRRRWERVAGRRAAAFVGSPWLADFEEFDAPPAISAETLIPEGAVLANSRCVVALDEVLATGDSVWSCEGETCAVRLATPINAGDLAGGATPLDQLATGTSARPLRGRWLRAVWDLVAGLVIQLAEDIPVAAPALRSASLMYDAVGPHPLTVEDGATVEPYVLFDTSSGPIIVRRGATISAFTRVVGPCYIGEGATIVGDRIVACAIGEYAKIRGEIATSVVLGHSNKGHTGFVGHSYLGRWVNLGSGTTTSNLKNTYGPVQLWTPEGMRDTGLQFLGTMFGDHSKTGIGTMLTTGCVIGAGANVFGSAMPPKYVPPFAWGEPPDFGVYEMEKFIAVAQRVMRRRDVELGARQAAHLRRVHAAHTAVARA